MICHPETMTALINRVVVLPNDDPGSNVGGRFADGTHRVRSVLYTSASACCLHRRIDVISMAIQKHGTVFDLEEFGQTRETGFTDYCEHCAESASYGALSSARCSSERAIAA